MKEKAYAKINLHLDVVDKRVDDFHDLEMVMATIDLYDELHFKKVDEDVIRVTSNKEITENVEDNLVYRIAKHLKETFGIKQGVAIHIEKKIPIAGGLAGGSADAAAALRGLNKLFKLKLSLEQLADIGETFGSDIPFCVHNKLCIARGKGEQLFFLKRKLNIPILIITPDLHVSTGEVFSHVDLSRIQNVKITTMTNAIYNKNEALIARNLYNALEPITFSLFKEIKALKTEILEAGPTGVLMSGSGPTLFVMDENRDLLESLAEKYRDRYFVELTKIK